MCNNVQFYDGKYDYFTGRLLPLPCNFCKGCRIDRRSLWEKRLTSEYVSQRCAFVCFTYDDYHLTWKKGASRPSVNKEQLHKFFDNFRHKIKTISELPPHCYYSYKVFAVAEYGEKNLRPHYHALFFGLDWLYFKKLFQDYWQFGNVDVGPIMKGGLRYPLKYMDKEQFGLYKDILYTDVGVEPTFSMKSPGIGSEFFVAHADDISKYGCLKLGSRFVPCPSYWKNKLINFNYAQIKQAYDMKKEYRNAIQSYAQSVGFASYDDYLRQSRYALECNYEAQSRKRHEAFFPISSKLPRVRLNPMHELEIYTDRSV